MRIFKNKRQQHVDLETLSEYIDGRLSDAENLRVKNHLNTCPKCAQELASLTYTVQLLHRVPTLAPRSVMTLAERPATAPVGWQSRVPTWAYGAAASAAIALFAVVLSADLGGLLTSETSTPDLRTQMEETVVESATLTQLAPEIEGTPAVPGTVLDPPAEQMVEVTREAEPEAELPESTALAAAAAPKPADAEGAPAIEALPPAELPFDRTPAETAADEDVAVLPEPADTRPDVDATTAPPSAASADVFEAFEPGGGGGGTSVLWRVLEGILAGIALLLVGWALWRARVAHIRAPG